jgi:2,5-dichlorohydroquinone reductive dechlorinase
MPEALHLYHAPNSICSQKVRAVLGFTGRRYRSHLIDIFEGQNYDPGYVRLRMEGCRATGLSLAREHLGSTSVNMGGCDACVVPTLVDADARQIWVDSKRICEKLALQSPSDPGGLMPEPLRSRIDEELSIIDNLPNYQILAMGVGKPSSDGLPNGFAVGKVARCDKLLAEHSGDEVLRAAYTAKRGKEQMAAERLFDEASLKQAYRQMAQAIRGLELRLPAQAGYLLGEYITLADLFWAVELVRFEDLGMAVLWAQGRSPRVARYYEKLCALKTIKQAVIDWPHARLPRRPDVPMAMFEG